MGLLLAPSFQLRVVSQGFASICLRANRSGHLTPSQNSVLLATWHCSKSAKHKSGIHNGLLALA